MDNPQLYINKYGGKAGGWFYLRDFGGFERHLLPLYYFAPDAEPDSVADILPNDIRENWLLRGTHRNDHEGFVDILDSVKLIGFDKENPEILEIFKQNINKMRESANDPELFAYSEYEYQHYDGKIGIAIQPYNPGKRGSIVEHPHERDTYLIDIVELTIDNHTLIDRLIVKGKKIDEKHSRIFDVRPFHEDMAEKVIELYEKVRSTEFISPKYSFQMEFGINGGRFQDKDKILFYQTRPFLEFLKPPYLLKGEEWLKYNCFGITPEEGITFPVVKTLYAHGANDIDHEFAWIVQIMTPRIGPYSRPKNMKVFLPRGNRIDSLEHNIYRWVKKADVSILSPEEQFTIDEYDTGDKIRIISNGLYHVLEPKIELDSLQLPELK